MMGLSPYTGHAQEMEQPYDWHRQRAGYREGSGNATFYLESRQAAWGVTDSRSWICFRPKLATGPTESMHSRQPSLAQTSSSLCTILQTRIVPRSDPRRTGSQVGTHTGKIINIPASSVGVSDRARGGDERLRARATVVSGWAQYVRRQKGTRDRRYSLQGWLRAYDYFMCIRRRLPASRRSCQGTACSTREYITSTKAVYNCKMISVNKCVYPSGLIYDL